MTAKQRSDLGSIGGFAAQYALMAFAQDIIHLVSPPFAMPRWKTAPDRLGPRPSFPGLAAAGLHPHHPPRLFV